MAALLDSACPLLGVVRSQEFPPSPPSGQRQPPYDPSAAVARQLWSEGLELSQRRPHQQRINRFGKAMIAIIRIEEPGLTQQGAHQAAVQGRRRSRYPIDWPIRASRAASSNGITEFAALEKAIRLPLPCSEWAGDHGRRAPRRLRYQNQMTRPDTA